MSNMVKVHMRPLLGLLSLPIHLLHHASRSVIAFQTSVKSISGWCDGDRLLTDRNQDCVNPASIEKYAKTVYICAKKKCIGYGKDFISH